LDVKLSKTEERRIEIRGDDIVSCILFNVLGGERQVFDRNVRPLGRHGGADDQDDGESI
jgi:hypothetical protein